MESRCKGSGTSTAKPNYARDCSGTIGPRLKESRAGTVNPIHAELLTDSEDPSRT